MIFSIDDSVMKQGEDAALVFAVSLQKAAEKRHYVEISLPMRQWINNELFGSDKYLGSLARESLVNNLEVWNPASICKRYQTTVTVGYGSGMLSIEEMALLVEEPSVVVLENGRYDWAVIKRWIKLYRKERGFDTINQQVHRAVTSHLLREHNAGGGNGSISNVMTVLMPIYKGLHALRLTTIFDSDKASAHDTVDHNQSLKAFLNENHIEWDELTKREIENYFDFETYRRAGLLTDNTQPCTTPLEEWDFHDIGKDKQIIMEKKDVEKLCDVLTKDELKTHATELSGRDEVQDVILHLAKYI